MKVLFATTNPAKVKWYAEELKKKGLDVITLKDLNLDIDAEEIGKDALENAYIKAKTFYDATGIISIGMDNNLFIENIKEEDQPGTHVRRKNGKTLSDEEMIEYYSNLVKKYGKKLVAKWVYGLVIYDGIEKKEYTWSKEEFYFVDKPSNKRDPGYPLDSISIDIKTNRYFVDLSEEDKQKNNIDTKREKALEFILNNLK